MIKKLVCLSLTLFFALLNFAQTSLINKIEPENWWVNMKYNKISLLVYGENLNLIEKVTSKPALKINSIQKTESNNYLIVNIEVSKVQKTGKYVLEFQSPGNIIKYDFNLYSRSNKKNIHQGFSNEDVIYLITPDRFCDGDNNNNFVQGYLEGYQPDRPYGRHGGDIQGIINKLTYLKNLGVSALWINPLTENNTTFSYHGYATTDLYKIDPRFGSNELYKKLVEEAHAKGLKIIIDHVSNHISIDHPWINNAPFKSWINGAKGNHLNASHEKMIFTDPYADKHTKEAVLKGWFTNEMPDLNQEDKLLAKYLIQNTIWWIEYTGLDGIREDTYPYTNQEFLAEWAKTIIDEYPKLNIVGEVWKGNTPFLAQFQKNNKLKVKPETYMPCVTDFSLQDIFQKYLQGNTGIYSVYETLAMDFVYPDPSNLLVFFDNHDVARGALVCKENIQKLKNVILMTLTLRGIPQILYGTEIGMKGGYDHGELRQDFPGGFINSTRDAFTKEGRTDYENEIYDFIAHILKLRTENEALRIGKLVHFPPQNDVYSYLKIKNHKKLLIIINDNKNELDYNLDYVIKETGAVKELEDLLIPNNLKVKDNKNLKITGNSIYIYELK